MTENKLLHWADYLVFALSLAIALFVGIAVAIKNKWHKESKESYLMANRDMKWFFVGVSSINTFFNNFIYIVAPAEFYYFGNIFVFHMISFYIAGFIMIIIVLPKYYRLGFLVTSMYEYFQHRFNLPLRMLIGFIYALMSMLYMAVNLYIPSLVLAQVSVLSLSWCITIGALVTVIYTAFGGMRAVIFVDSIQFLIILAAMCTIVIKGVIDAGGMGRVWEIYSVLGERNNWRDLDPAPWNRHNLWNVIFLLALNITAKLCLEQASVQRCLTVKTLRLSQLSAVLTIVLTTAVLALAFLAGAVAFAHLGGDDPLLAGQINSREQIIPYFIMDILGHLHGIPGLMVAAFYAAAMSTISSSQNSAAAVLLEDIIEPIHKKVAKNKLTDRQSGMLARGLGVIIGLITLGLAMAIPHMGGSIMDFFFSVTSFSLGPMVGLLVCGFFLFWVESWGAMIGFICAVAWNLMLYFGKREYGTGLGLDRAPTFSNNFANRTDFPDPTARPNLFDISYTWYNFLGIMIVIIVGTVISLIVHCCKHGHLRASDIMPQRSFRYTKEDFLAAFPCRKNQQDDGDSEVIKAESVQGCYINEAYEKTFL